MTDDRLQERLSRAADSGRAEAELAAWPIVRGAFKAERPSRRPRAHARAAVAFASVIVAALIALAAAGSPTALARWLHEQISGKPGVKHSAPALTHLPSGGRLLVAARSGVWVVEPDGSRRLLRGYAGAAWSPRGLYLAAWRGHQLIAAEPNGRVHWSLARAGVVAAADWSPDGYRIAYLSGRSLRVVAGDGTGDAQLRAHVARVAPVWRPRAPHLLLLAPRSREIELLASDVRAPAWRQTLSYRVRSFAWSRDGKVVAVAGSSRVTILDGATGRIRTFLDAPRGFHVGAIAFANRGLQLALALESPTGQTRVAEVDPLLRRAHLRQIFAGIGAFTGLAWSPGDRWLLVEWPAADQWLFLRASRASGIRAVSDIAGQFDPRARPAEFPRIGGWCCG